MSRQFSSEFILSGVLCMVALLASGTNNRALGEEFQLELRSQTRSSETSAFERQFRQETWKAGETAFIVCDVWDYHHCLNAVNRLNEFGPRLNDVLAEARRRGAVIIHAPSDCMASFEGHPARLRVTAIPEASNRPAEIESWCSKIPAEELASYPIDQSDGGEDDDPEEHARWAAKLKALGRNPAMPWKTQSSLITIDPERDLISDRGDEVWNVLEHYGIRNVVLTGVHTNMCVLGRPFGLRQMVRNGKNVVLMRDMTDCMYNPKRWPYVDHFTGNDLIISHVERYVCPTVTSNQLLGGDVFRFSGDQRSQTDITDVKLPELSAEAMKSQWNTISVPSEWTEVLKDSTVDTRIVWYRSTLRISANWLEPGNAAVMVHAPEKGSVKAWLNGKPLKGIEPICLACSEPEPIRFVIPNDLVEKNDANLLVLRAESTVPVKTTITPPVVTCGKSSTLLKRRWQIRIGDDPQWSGIPLPAKFGTGTDIVFEIR
ncbi:MAG: hypothetical protein JNL58_11590 [Planctomyces sp.]|nr:hypothetical protein [Planctomyces sp.]